MMKIKLIISVLLSLSVVACAKQYKDSVTILHVQGRVLDQASNFPLEDVDVYFIDTGYDDILSKRQEPVKIGQSDSRGKIIAHFNYWWGRKTSAFDNKPKATFDILLSKEAYLEKRFQFKESALKTDGLTFLVDLEDVYLVRKNE
ncbi:MAG: hypothetical protein JRF29_04980 [Deltaproteobacteria bacterium]|jgi:hypothetical protein|nr:hypothetical protein [Deltaproteobacteria bacterium]